MSVFNKFTLTKYKVLLFSGIVYSLFIFQPFLNEIQAQPLAYATRQEQDEVVIVDLGNGDILGTIPTIGRSPFEITFFPELSELYVTTLFSSSTYSGSLNILDTSILSPTDSISAGDVPIEIALLPDGSKVYTADWTGSTVTAIDLTTKTDVATIPTAFLSYDVASSPDGSRIYATALRSSNLFVIDTDTDTVVDLIPIGRDFLAHVAITPDGKKAYITEFRNRINIVDLSTKTVIGNIPYDTSGANANNGALDIEIDSEGRFAYALGYDTINVIDLSTDVLIKTIPVGIQLSDIKVDTTGNYVYATTIYQTYPEIDLNEIVKIETYNFTIVDRYIVGGLLVGLAVEPSVLKINIDIKPDDLQNTINLNSKGVIPVAILGSDTFDTMMVEPESITLSGAGVKLTANGKKLLCHVANVNGDTYEDLLCR